MQVAVVLTVKNEARLLRDNVLYHHAIGVDKVFVYFDNTTDDGKDTVSDLPFVNIQDSVPAEKYTHFKYLDKFTSQAEAHHTARQCLNTFDAMQSCKVLGIDWLISIDADELIGTDLDAISNLKTFFKGIPSSVDVVNFKVYEVLQRQLNYKNVFAEETLFKSQRSFKRRHERLFKYVYNPFTGKHLKFSFWYGQHLGKGAIRLNTNVIPHNVHRYKRINGKAAILEAGFVLHYHAFDAVDFIKKFTNFRNHPNTFLSGNTVESLKLLLRDVVNTSGLSNDELKDYFKTNLMFNEKEVSGFLKNKTWCFFNRKERAVLSIKSVQEVFKSMH